MSYNKLGFASGQTLKADHLNHMESGIEAIANNVQIKKIVFTDRPSMYSWLLDNFSKVIYTNVISTENPWPVKLMVHYCGTIPSGINTDFALVQISTLPEGTIVPSNIRITPNITQFKIDERINLESDGSVSCTSLEYTTVPDEYWSALQIEFTVYYFAE